MASFPHCNSDSISCPTSAQSVSVSEADGKLSSWQFLFDTLADGESRRSMLYFYLLEDRLAQSVSVSERLPSFPKYPIALLRNF